MTETPETIRNLKHFCINKRNGTYTETYKLFKIFLESMDIKHPPIELEGFLYKASSIIASGNVQNLNSLFREWLKYQGWERVEDREQQ